MRTRVLRAIGMLFALVGVVLFLGAAFSAYRTEDFLSRSVVTQGQVIDLRFSEDVYFPVVQFDAGLNGPLTFQGTTGAKPPAFSKGQTVTVRYDPADPLHVFIDSAWEIWFVTAVLGFLGAIFTLFGGMIVLTWWLSGRKKRWLVRHGTWIETDFVEVQENTQLEVNGKHARNIVSQWLEPDSNRLYTFYSDNLWVDPTPFLKGKIPVVIDPSDPYRYWMDTTFLPKGDERLRDIVKVKLT